MSGLIHDVAAPFSTAMRENFSIRLRAVQYQLNVSSKTCIKLPTASRCAQCSALHDRQSSHRLNRQSGRQSSRQSSRLTQLIVARKLHQFVSIRPRRRDMADQEIKDRLKSVASGDDARLVSVVEFVLGKLEQQKLAWRLRILPRKVGVHKANRNGYGIAAPAVHTLGAEIVTMGRCPPATAHAVCIEDPSGETGSWTSNLAKISPGLGNVPADEILYGSLACSHTNAFLVAVLCGVRSDNSVLTTDGCMDKNKLAMKDPLLADALEYGLTWLVASSKVPEMYPEFCSLVQAARNSTGSVHRKENEFQLLSKAQNMVNAMYKEKGSVDFDTILKVIVKHTNTPPEIVNPILRFVQRYGGGDTGYFAKNLEGFHRMFVPAGRVVPATTFDALASLKLSPRELCPFFMAAVLKIQANCPAGKVCPNKVCKYVSTQGIASLQKARKSDMLAAEAILKECRSVAVWTPSSPASSWARRATASTKTSNLRQKRLSTNCKVRTGCRCLAAALLLRNHSPTWFSTPMMAKQLQQRRCLCKLKGSTLDASSGTHMMKFSR